MQNSTSSVKQTINNTTLPIANRVNKFIPIANSQLVDTLLNDYTELIDPLYTKWFAKRFYDMPFDTIHRCASEARADGKDARKLFAFLVNKVYKKL